VRSIVFPEPLTSLAKGTTMKRALLVGIDDSRKSRRCPTASMTSTLGARCPRLVQHGHGSWYLGLELPEGRRQQALDVWKQLISILIKGDKMSDKKVIFVAFAIEDERQRDFLKGQSLHPRAPFEFIDMSVKEPYDSNWKDRVRTRIRRSHGVIVLVSKNSLTSSGQKWEIQCAKDERKPIRGIWAYKDDRTSIDGGSTYVWNDANISNFIDSL
jgi:hypothetical protein